MLWLVVTRSSAGSAGLTSGWVPAFVSARSSGLSAAMRSPYLDRAHNQPISRSASTARPADQPTRPHTAAAWTPRASATALLAALEHLRPGLVWRCAAVVALVPAFGVLVLGPASCPLLRFGAPAAVDRPRCTRPDSTGSAAHANDGRGSPGTGTAGPRGPGVHWGWTRRAVTGHGGAQHRGRGPVHEFGGRRRFEA